MKYTREMIAEAVRTSTTLVETLRKLGARTTTGGMSTHIRRRIRAFGIDTSHFLGAAHAKGKKLGPSPWRLPWREVLVKHTRSYRTAAHVLRRALQEAGVPYVCAQCQGSTWRGAPLTLEIDHENGDWRDDRKENLRFLCPNCHSQTSTYRSGNKPRRVVLVGPGTPIKPPAQFDSERADRYRQPTKIAWPSKDALHRLIRQHPMSVVGKKLGVSDSAVRKRCKKLGIPLEDACGHLPWRVSA